MKKNIFVEAIVVLTVVCFAGFGLLALYAQSLGGSPGEVIGMTGGGPGDSSKRADGLHPLHYSTDEILHFDVFVPTNGPTNMLFQAYFASVTPGGTNPPLQSVGSALNSMWFITTDPDYFNGSETLVVVPGEMNRFYFQLNGSTFVDEEKGNTWVTIVGSGTAGTGTNAVGYRGATLYTIKSPYTN